MKRTLFIFLIISFNSVIAAQSGWNIIPLGTDALLTEIALTGDSTAYISASGGMVFRTTNAGSNWISQSIINNEDLTSICFPSAETGYTSSSEGKILKTTNGGVNWTQINSPVSISILKIYFIDDKTGFISTGPADNGKIFKTDNGGSNWTIRGPGTVFPEVLSINFPGPDTGFASARNGVILKSTDAGDNWINIQSGSAAGDWFCIFFTDNNTGYAVSPFPQYMIKTTNSGTNWNVIYNNADHFLVFVDFPSHDTGYAVGGADNSSVILKTTNAGLNWQSEIINYNGHANDIEFINNNTGYIVGEFGRVYKTTNGGKQVGINQSSGNIPDGFMLYQNFPNPFNPVTIVNYELPSSGNVSLKVYNLLGTELAELINEKQTAGSHSFEFKGNDFPSGIYIYRLTAESGGRTISQCRKMVLIK